MKEELAKRKERKAKKPTFRKQDAHKKAKLSDSWRKPRGRQSKIRLHKRGYARHLSNGWGSPKSVKGLSPEGLNQVPVSTIAELSALDAKKDGVILNRTLGAKKKEALIVKAKELHITILNIDAEKALAAITERITERQKTKKERVAKKAKKEAKKPIEEKVKEETKDPAAEKKAVEAEKQKVLTKKGAL